jgi:hypothetical protein
VRLGDEMNGFVAAETVISATEILPWLQEDITHFYPVSNLCRLTRSRNTRARGGAAIRAAGSWRTGHLPTLRRAGCGSAGDGRIALLGVSPLRQLGRSRAA